MNDIVIYKSRYGSTKTYAEWIAEALSCNAIDEKGVKVEDLLSYDTIIYGGGLYAENIAGINLITKNLDKLRDKKIIIYTTGITPLDCKDYYDKLVMEKNFKGKDMTDIRVYHFLGKMILSELSFPHRAAIKTLKKIMSEKQNPTAMERLLIDLCDADGDFTNKDAICDLVEYAKGELPS